MRNLIMAFLTMVLILNACQSEEPASQSSAPNKFVSSDSLSESLDDTVLAKQFFAKAEAFAKAEQFDSANVYFEKAAAIYKKTNEWERYVRCSNALGVNLRKQKKYEDALVCLNEALKNGLNHLGENHSAIGKCYHQIGYIYLVEGDYDRAFANFNQSLKIARKLSGEIDPDVALAYFNIGESLLKKGEYDKALEQYQKSLYIRIQLFGKNHPKVALAYNNTGNAHYYKGEYDTALEQYEAALKIRLQQPDSDQLGIAQSYNNIAMIYTVKGDYDNSLQYLFNSLNLKLEILDENHLSVARTYHNLGHAFHWKEKLGQALNYYNKSLNIKRELLSEHHPATTNTYENIGIVYSEQGNYDQALSYLNKSLNINLEYRNDYPNHVARNYYHIGTVYHYQGEYGKAREFYEKAITKRLNFFGIYHSVNTAVYREIGETYLIEKNFAEALHYLQKSIISSVPNFKETNIYVNPPLQDFFLGKSLLKSLMLKAEAFEKSFSSTEIDLKEVNKIPSIKKIESSFATYKLAAALIDTMRFSYKVEGSKLFLKESFSEIYGNGIRTAHKLFEITGDADYHKEAFQFAEKRKSTILAQSLWEVEAKQFAGIPNELLEKEKDLRINLTFYETQRLKEKQKRENRDEEKIRRFESNFFSLKIEYEKLREKLEKEYPAYYQLKYLSQIASVPDLQSNSDQETVIINYFLGNSSLHIFTVTQDDFAVFSFPRDSAFTSLVNTFCASIKRVLDKQEYLQSSRQLYDLLIKPVEQQIASKKKLIILPDDILYYLPFEALITSDVPIDGQTDFTDLDYMVKRHEISYHYSATLYLGSMKKKPAERLAADFMGFAPVFSKAQDNGYILAANTAAFEALPAEGNLQLVTRDGKNLLELKHSEREVRAIVNMFDSVKRNNIGFFHREASEENFKANAGKYRYVHISTHGFMNEEKPQLSGLAFSQPKDSGAAEDGILYSAEAYNLNLNADLVVLSSCESGIGKLVKGEGLMSLTRGFLYSGANNMIVSLWKVFDEHTSELMIDLYKHILEGKSYSAALREAKLKMIENPNTAFPASWASFVLIGN